MNNQLYNHAAHRSRQTQQNGTGNPSATQFYSHQNPPLQIQQQQCILPTPYTPGQIVHNATTSMPGFPQHQQFVCVQLQTPFIIQQSPPGMLPSPGHHMAINNAIAVSTAPQMHYASQSQYQFNTSASAPTISVEKKTRKTLQITDPSTNQAIENEVLHSENKTEKILLENKENNESLNRKFKEQVKMQLTLTQDFSREEPVIICNNLDLQSNQEDIEDGESVNDPTEHVDGFSKTEESEENILKLEKELERYETEKDPQNSSPNLVYERSYLFAIHNLIKAKGYQRIPGFAKMVSSLVECAIDKASTRIISPKEYREKKKTPVPAENRPSKFSGTGEFKPPWQQQSDRLQTQQERPPSERTPGTSSRFNIGHSGRVPYFGRHSDDRKCRSNYGGRFSLRQRPQSPMSSEQQQKASSAAFEYRKESSLPPENSADADTCAKVERKNVWKPLRRANPDTSEEELKIEKTKKEIRSILNKITPSTKDELTKDFLAYKIYDDEKILPSIIDLIFEKAIDEPHFCAIYSELCVNQSKQEKEEKGVDSKKFNTGIVTKCQTAFNDEQKFCDKIEELKRRRKMEDIGEEELKSLDEQIEAANSRDKRRLHGIIGFIACLFHHQAIVPKIIVWSAIELFKLGAQVDEEKKLTGVRDETYIEYSIGMVEKAGGSYQKLMDQRKLEPEPPKEKKTMAQVTNTSVQEQQQPETDMMERIFMLFNVVKAKVSNRVRFMIVNLEELRKRNWVPRGGDKGPKKISEVHDEMQKEKEENLAERALYMEEKKRERDEQNKGFRGRTPWHHHRGGDRHHQHVHHNREDGGDFRPTGILQRPNKYPYQGRSSYQDPNSRKSAAHSQSSSSVAPSRFKTTHLKNVDDDSHQRSNWAGGAKAQQKQQQEGKEE